jgi:hypothetical protein
VRGAGAQGHREGRGGRALRQAAGGAVQGSVRRISGFGNHCSGVDWKISNAKAGMDWKVGDVKAVRVGSFVGERVANCFRF